MSRHLTFNDLLALQKGYLAPEESAKIRQHLEACPECAKSASFIADLVSREKSAKPRKTVTQDCVSHEELTMFLNGEFPAWQQRKIEKHLAVCESCRRRLADIIRASAPPVSKQERTKVAALSSLNINEQLRVIENLVESKNQGRNASFITKLRALGSSRFFSQIAWAVVILILAIYFGLTPLRNWQASNELSKGMTLMRDTYPIARGELRPHGFQPGLFSEQHSNSPPEKIIIIAESLQKAGVSSTNRREAKRAQAQLLYFEGKYQSADSLLRILLRENEQDHAAWNDLGVVAARRADTSAALAAFDRALQLAPEYEEAKYNRKILTSLLEAP